MIDVGISWLIVDDYCRYSMVDYTGKSIYNLLNMNVAGILGNNFLACYHHLVCPTGDVVPIICAADIIPQKALIQIQIT